MTKKEYRKIVNGRRKEMTDEEVASLSAKICELFVTLPEYREAKILYSYVDYNHEVQTWPIMKQAMKDGKKVAVPRVNGTAMDYYYITSEDDLEPGYFGIMEPKTTLPLAEPDGVFFMMPGVAFDRAHHRVGYGGGFYDRYQERFPDFPTVAIAFECQLFDEVPFEEFDKMPMILITEDGISRI